jgi:hypothetical protein
MNAHISHWPSSIYGGRWWTAGSQECWWMMCGFRRTLHWMLDEMLCADSPKGSHVLVDVGWMGAGEGEWMIILDERSWLPPHACSMSPLHHWFIACRERPGATPHMSQEPWLCNAEDPWLSSKGRTMGLGKAVLCSHGHSSVVWSENGPCCCIFCWRTREKYLFNIRCLKLYQFERITWWCLFVLELVLEYALQSVLKYVMLEKK